MARFAGFLRFINEIRFLIFTVSDLKNILWSIENKLMVARGKGSGRWPEWVRRGGDEASTYGMKKSCE